MKIKSIRLNRFRGFKDLEVQFPANENLVVFIGENGSGKTSLMEGISMILRDTLYKHHQYGTVDWNTRHNVHTEHRNGSISIELQGPRRTYQLIQSLFANRTRFISEDKLALELKRDLTDEDRIAHYEAQSIMALEEKFYEKALGYALKVAEIREGALKPDYEKLRNVYLIIGNIYNSLKNYSRSIEYSYKSLEFNEMVLTNDTTYLDNVYCKLGFSYYKMADHKNSINYYSMAIDIQINLQPPESLKLANTYRHVGDSYFEMKEFRKAIEYYLKALGILKKILEPDDLQLAAIYNVIGAGYGNSGNFKLAIEYFSKTITIQEKTLSSDDSSLLLTYSNMAIAFTKSGNKVKAAYYKEKAGSKGNETATVATEMMPEIYRKSEGDTLQYLNEYIELWMPLVLHYTAGPGNAEPFKDALPIAFHIPMTTNFDMVSDWFTEQENDENRKRLRVDPKYRSAELETVREVITEGLTLLNGVAGNRFTQLQTETDDTVTDGQISSWLSIKKDELTLNVNQLSDGEKRILVLFIDITRRLTTAAKQNKQKEILKGTGIVLIDEIEQHLHPKWQRMLLPTLKQLFPNLQFVATTHSPQVLSYVPNGCAFTLENGKAYPQNTYGRNNEWILEAVMDDVNRPKEVQAKLDAYFTAIKDDHTEIALELRKELETLIGADEPELLKADILIRRKQKSAVKNEANT